MTRALVVSSLFAAASLLSTASFAHASILRTAQPVSGILPSIGNESSEYPGAANYPPLDSIQTIEVGCDRGTDFQCPTDYPPQRHAAFSQSTDTYYVFYEWNDARNFATTMKYWQTVGPIGFWSIAYDTPDTFTDTGRPSALGTADGVSYVFHGATGDNEYNTHYAAYDSQTSQFEWTALSPQDGTSDVFPYLARSSAGVLASFYAKGEIDVLTNDLRVSLSDDDGATWTDHLVHAGWQGTWRQPTAAADPSNGDLYVSYADDPDNDLNADIMIQRSTDGGLTWSTPAVVASGVANNQLVLPSLVVDSQHQVHMTVQGNITDTYTSGGLRGFGAVGPAGLPWYIRGALDGDGAWTTDTIELLNSRDNLSAVADSCGLSIDPVALATDTISGLPQLGIAHNPAGDVLYATYAQPYYAVATPEGYNICGTWQVWMQTYDLAADVSWGDRTLVSSITVEETLDGRSAIYPGITQDVPASGPGIIWSEMDNALAPATVLFNRPLEGPPSVGIEGDSPNAPTTKIALDRPAPNPFNPSTMIRYRLSQAGPVRLSVYDVAGRVVRRLVDGSQGAGEYGVHWNGTDETGRAVASGVYFSRLEFAGETFTRSMVLAK